MVRDPSPLLRWKLGGPYVEVSIHLERVAIDHFAAKFRTNTQREIALPRARRTDNCDERKPAHVLSLG